MITHWHQGVSEDEYARYVFRLQNQCDLTFREAVAVLNPTSYATELAGQWGVTKEAVYNLSRRGWDKIWNAVGEENWDAVDELAPVHLWHVF